MFEWIRVWVSFSGNSSTVGCTSVQCCCYLRQLGFEFCHCQKLCIVVNGWRHRGLNWQCIYIFSFVLFRHLLYSYVIFYRLPSILIHPHPSSSILIHPHPSSSILTHPQPSSGILSHVWLILWIFHCFPFKRPKILRQFSLCSLKGCSIGGGVIRGKNKGV